MAHSEPIPEVGMELIDGISLSRDIWHDVNWLILR
jgi:hypothetical protein